MNMSKNFLMRIGLNDMDEKKFVTYEMFEQYHKRLMEYIRMHDELILWGETTCPKCGAIIKSDKCDKCANQDLTN